MRAPWLAALVLLAPTVVRAQECAPTPPDFVPHVTAWTRSATLITPGESVRGSVWLTPVSCSYGPGPPAVRAREARALVVEGPGAETELPLRIANGEWRLRAPSSPGAYRVEIRSVPHPELAPAIVRFRVMDPARVIRATLELVSPRDRPQRRVQLSLETPDGLRAEAFATRRRGALRAEIAIEPGVYRAHALHRSALVEIDGPEPREVTFRGSHVAIDLDGLPAGDRLYELAITYADGTRARVPLDEHGAELGDDVPPGRASVAVRAADALRWETVRELSIEVPPASVTTLRWSSPMLFAGEDPAPRAWTDLAGAGERRASGSPTEASFLAVRGDVAVALGEHAWERARGRWLRWVVPDELVRGAMLSHTGPRITQNDTVRAAVVGPEAWAAIEGGPYVLLRTPRGLAEERIATYDPTAPYPCYTTDIAARSSELIAVGRCRAHAPEWDSVPTEGFVAERGPERWIVRRGFAPLRAIVADGDRFVAVGDGGELAVRDASGAWRRSRHGSDDLVGVAVSGSRVLALTRGGAVVELRDHGPPAVVYDRPSHPATAICAAGDALLTLHPARRFRDRVNELPAVVAVHRAGTSSDALRRDAIAAIACDGDRAWALVGGDLVPVLP